MGFSVKFDSFSTKKNTSVYYIFYVTDSRNGFSKILAEFQLERNRMDHNDLYIICGSAPSNCSIFHENGMHCDCYCIVCIWQWCKKSNKGPTCRRSIISFDYNGFWIFYGIHWFDKIKVTVVKQEIFPILISYEFLNQYFSVCILVRTTIHLLFSSSN